jgi:ribonuclease Y
MGIEHKDQEFIRTVGRLQYRTSYGQNIMKHSMEVGWICRMLGAEIGLNERTCLIAGFLHDIGKAIDQDPNQKDCHDALTKEIMDKHGFSWEEVHAAWVHHDAEPQQTAEAFLVKAADAISAARPGARQESFEKYLERVQDIERTAIEFEGVKRAFAISAGREVRVVVDPDKMDDGSLPELARKVAKKIEEDITYPGKIKVNVIRRTKYTETSK